MPQIYHGYYGMRNKSGHVRSRICMCDKEAGTRRPRNHENRSFLTMHRPAPAEPAQYLPNVDADFHTEPSHSLISSGQFTRRQTYAVFSTHGASTRASPWLGAITT